jgi:hypothetical protein
MLRLAHLINPVAVDARSDLFIAQPITFETVRRAAAFASSAVAVDLFTAQFAEDHPVVPADFRRTADLTRSALDFGQFKTRRKLPLVRDLFDRLHAASDADYMIYTNVDIALMPSFYVSVAALIAQGYDAFVINRRTISKAFTRIDELPLMYAQLGEPHPGHDCFVWRRDAYPLYRLANVCIGTIGVGKAILLNQLCTAARWQEFTDLHLTFHLGSDRAWLSDEEDDYRAFNLAELSKIVAAYRDEGRLADHPMVHRFTANLGV